MNKENKKLHNKFNSIMMRLFSYKEIVIEMLVYLVNESWIDLLDFSTLEEISKDFVSPKELDDFQSDILWKINLKETKQEVFIYIHTEFQSSPHRLMPFRFLNYQYLVYDKIMTQRKKEEKSKLLPFIFPILFYHGKNKWNFETDISKLIEKPFKEAKNYIPSFNFFKIMINEKTYEELSKYESVLANNFACNNVKTKEDFLFAIKKVGKLLYDLIPQEHKLALSEDIAKYLSFISNGRVSTEIIINILNKYEEDKMTLAQLFEEERKEGIKEGIEKGKYERDIETAIEMLKLDSDIVFVEKVTKLPLEKIKELKREL